MNKITAERNSNVNSNIKAKDKDVDTNIKSTVEDVVKYLCNAQNLPKKLTHRVLGRLAPDEYKKIFGEATIKGKGTNEQDDLNKFIYVISEFGEFKKMSNLEKTLVLDLLINNEKYEHAVILAHFGGIIFSKKGKLPEFFQTIMRKNKLMHKDENGKLDINKSEENVYRFVSDAFSNYVKGLNLALKNNNSINYQFSHSELWLFALNYAENVNKEFYKQKHKEAIDWCIENYGSISELIINRIENPELYNTHLKIIKR